jgi:hypothetical protein
VIPVQILQNIYVARQLAREHEALLRRVTFPARGRNGSHVRQWLGRQLVRTGTWLASDQPMHPAPAR